MRQLFSQSAHIGLVERFCQQRYWGRHNLVQAGARFVFRVDLPLWCSLKLSSPAGGPCSEFMTIALIELAGLVRMVRVQNRPGDPRPRYRHDTLVRRGIVSGFPQHKAWIIPQQTDHLRRTDHVLYDLTRTGLRWNRWSRMRGVEHG